MNTAKELDNACLRFKQALMKPYAIQRREQYKKAQADYLARAWKLARKQRGIYMDLVIGLVIGLVFFCLIMPCESPLKWFTLEQLYNSLTTN